MRHCDLAERASSVSNQSYALGPYAQVYFPNSKIKGIWRERLLRSIYFCSLRISPLSLCHSKGFCVSLPQERLVGGLPGFSSKYTHGGEYGVRRTGLPQTVKICSLRNSKDATLFLGTTPAMYAPGRLCLCQRVPFF